MPDKKVTPKKPAAAATKTADSKSATRVTKRAMKKSLKKFK